MKIEGLFDYTQRDFWGGPWYRYWMLIVATIFCGFWGGDHFLLRSPTSAFLKLLVNIFGLGIWWFYDICQIVGEKDTVMKHGLSAPIVGPLGIGAGMFVDNQPNATTSKSPLRYLAYLVLMFIPWGFDLVIAGDYKGGLAKFLSTIAFFLWPVLIIWMIFGVFRAFFMPKTLFTEGPDRLFPFSWYLGKHGPSKLGPVDLPIGGEDAKNCDSTSGWFSWLSFIPTVIASAVNLVFPGVTPAVQAASKTVEIGAKTASNVIEAASGPAVAAISTASSLAQTVPSAISAVPQIASNVQGQLTAFTDPKTLEQMAIRVPTGLETSSVLKSMSGGGGGDSDIASAALFGLFSFVLLGGSLYGIKRLNTSILSFNSIRNGDKGRERNDTPPQPSGP
jgi:hypothetical protein